MYYEIKTKRQDNEGKDISECFITNCDLFAQAELKGLEEHNNECDVISIKRSKITEIVNNKEDDKYFFKATLVDTFTDDNGKEKEIKYYLLVCAKDTTEANKLILDHIKQGLQDFRLDAIQKTNIINLI